MEKAQSDWGRQGWSRKVSAPLPFSVLACGLHFIWFKSFAENFAQFSLLPTTIPAALGPGWCLLLLLFSGASWREWRCLYPCPIPCQSCSAPSASKEPSGKGSVPVASRPPPPHCLAHNSMGSPGQRPCPLSKNPSPLSWLFLPPQLLGNSKAYCIFAILYEKLCLFSFLFLTKLSSSSHGKARRSSADLQPLVLVIDPYLWIHSNVSLVHGNHPVSAVC